MHFRSFLYMTRTCYRHNESIKIVCHNVCDLPHTQYNHQSWCTSSISEADNESYHCNHLFSLGITMLWQPCWWHFQIQIGITKVSISPKQIKINRIRINLGNKEGVPAPPSPDLQQVLHMMVMGKNDTSFQQFQMLVMHVTPYHVTMPWDTCH